MGKDLRKTDIKEIGKKISLKLKGRKISEEQKVKLRNAMKNKKNVLGKHWNIKDTSKMCGRIPWNYIDGRSKNIGTGRYGKGWIRQRKKILIRDNYTCQNCGKINIRLEIHHKIPFLTSFDNSDKNLITLCKKCHIKAERLNYRRIKICQN